MSPSNGHPFRAFPRMALGCDYNPEQWPEASWPQDVELMHEAGVRFVTLGVFAWAVLEPSPGRFETEWLARAVDLLHAADIAVDLATATASPPPWLTTAHPDVLPVDREGRRRWPGSRQAWCPSSPAFAERSLLLVEEMGRRFGGHPAVVLWHVSNELGGHNGRCYCDVSAAAFRDWLRGRYGSVDAVNEAWSTTVWSQRYGAWDEVLPPRLTTAQPNPAQTLDYARFSSDELLARYRAERDALRRLSPGVPVTTNLMVTAHQNEQDYWRWAPEQDVVSNDHYLDARLPHPRAELSFAADLTRGLAGGGPWLLMETATSAVSWQPVNVPQTRGELLRTALAHVARGADGVGFFQWRASPGGAERFHSALVPHAGTDTAVWRAVVELGSVLRRLEPLAGTRVEADVALLFDWEAWWACDEPGATPSDQVRYLDQVHRLHRALARTGVTTDVVHPEADLSGYRLAVVPTLFLCSDRAAEGLESFVSSGGHALVTYFSGIVDPNGRVRSGAYPGAFRDLLGVRSEQFHPMRPGERVRLAGRVVDGGSGDAWAEELHVTDARAEAVVADGPLAGTPALTRREVGDGSAWYLATRLDEGTTLSLIREIAAAAGVSPTAVAPDGVELVRRRGEGGSFLFALNHDEQDADVHVFGQDLVSGAQADGLLRLGPGGVAVVRES